ncbi:MAG: Phosphatidylserine/phosphatidylglycerophosphate/cardiolipin synthase [Marmoricola sp.]|nr:Phosphatidylserine/phosphatidylglycerophosphate/cardiolipin synthase [Marmoricola sp.]
MRLSRDSAGTDLRMSGPGSDVEPMNVGMNVNRRLTRVLIGIVLIALVGGLTTMTAQSNAAPVPSVAAAATTGNKACKPRIVKSGSTTKKVYPKTCLLPYLDGWRPPLGPVFNDPLGSSADAQKILRRVISAIKHTPAKSVIRIAVYSFDRSDVAYWLRKAKDRGVYVQIAVNRRVISGVSRKLQKYLGANPKAASFLISCNGPCRKVGSVGNLHNKVYSFSRTGGARDFIITSSGNLTSKGVYRQWNDSYGVAQDTGLWDAWLDMFTQIKNRKQKGPRTIRYTSTVASLGLLMYKTTGKTADPIEESQTEVVPISAKYKPSQDPVLHRLDLVNCNAPKGYGSKGHTVIRIMMYAMFKSRGETLARKLAALKKKGCVVQMIMSVPGGKTTSILRTAKIPMRSADWLFTERDPALEDGIGGYGPRFYAHYKVMALNGRFNGKPTMTVWTGSENWDSASFVNEEIVLRVNRKGAYRKYSAQFNKMWYSRATHRMGIKPTYGP